jgi:hypothetical protein
LFLCFLHSACYLSHFYLLFVFFFHSHISYLFLHPFPFFSFLFLSCVLFRFFLSNSHLFQYLPHFLFHPTLYFLFLVFFPFFVISFYLFISGFVSFLLVYPFVCLSLLTTKTVCFFPFSTLPLHEILSWVTVMRWSKITSLYDIMNGIHI